MVLMDQPFAALVKELFDIQKYPNLPGMPQPTTGAVAAAGGRGGGGGGGGGGVPRFSGFLQWSLPFGAVSAVNWIALVAQRRMHEFSLTREQLVGLERRQARPQADEWRPRLLRLPHRHQRRRAVAVEVEQRRPRARRPSPRRRRTT